MLNFNPTPIEFGDAALARIIAVLCSDREEDKDEDLNRHIEAARLVGV